mmetsp:Transcript_27553/g.33457  ORF Transcript_27553/g.33457 Transcript_27553/m.33457 type:complete len:1478 (+) Transcript_27553:475-4908(+)|eukprot:CAMPEP_0172493182 /NCGR_PEP_ID=MMETSP1066-20121228/24548_1 /TAXON_ID=671091 /ORGANISM="Coscinodiscus wailesii, Strain CCMP2513" /LENGTH=1477 /DNA_ID=CAMNT_0013263211 /DNA_START=143 /DNA_END=4576 /DNA_ORIENTATION=-
MVTTTRIRSFKGLLKYPLTQTREVGTRQIDISTIDRVQRGQLTQRFNLAKQTHKSALQMQKAAGSVIPGTTLEETNSLSVVYNGCKESIDIIVPNDSDLNALVNGINDLIAMYKLSTRKVHRDVLLVEHAWVDSDRHLKATCSFNDFTTMLPYLNADINRLTLNSLYKKFCQSANTRPEAGINVRQAALFLDQLRVLMHATSKVTDPATLIFQEYEDTPGSRAISDKAFLNFLHVKQGETRATIESVHELFNRLNEQELAGVTVKGDVCGDRISKKTFIAFMYSDENDAFDPIKARVGRSDMTQPLSNYWINTSHKTYRTVDEKEASGAAEGGASVQMYVNALYRGCRCLEIDVWDGDSNLGNEPVVCNGDPSGATLGTVSDKIILFVDVIKAVKAFLVSRPDSYPIILGIENHCSLSFQEKMAQHLNGVLDDRLFRPPASMSTLPSPESIKGKVIIRSKLPDTTREGATVINDDFDTENDLAREEINSLPEIPSNDEDTIETGVVIGFDTVGSIVSDSPHIQEKTPDELLYIAKMEARESRQAASIAEQYAFELQVKASQAEEKAAKLLAKIGMTFNDVEKQKAAAVASVGSRLFSRASRAGTSMGGSRVDSRVDNVNDNAGTLTQNSTMTSLNSESKRGVSNKSIASASHMDGTNTVDRSVVDSTIKSESRISRAHSEESDSMYDGADSSTEGEMELSEFMSFKTGSERADAEEGMEVQDFFENAVEHAKTQYAAADADAIDATEAAAIAMADLQQASAALSAAEDVMKDTKRVQAERIEAAERAAAEARANRGHADTASQRVITVRDLLKKCKENAGTSESVSATAHAESKISEQRAVEAEARASKAQVTAEADRVRADTETKTEEKLENEAASLQRKANDAKQAVDKAKERVANAIEALGKVDQKISDIENSEDHRMNSDNNGNQQLVQMEKHKQCLEEKKYCLEKVKEASISCNKFEVASRKANLAFEEASKKAKAQVTLAAWARRQADQSTAIAEQLIEHAEEEREAANLRHIACEKAEVSVQRSDADRLSMEAQLAEAERAAAESEQLAFGSRQMAEQLASEAQLVKDISKEESRLATLLEQKEQAQSAYDMANKRKLSCDTKAAEAKRILTTSSEVLQRAQHEAAAEIHRLNAERQAERNAMMAHTQAKHLRRKADKAKDAAAKAVAKAADVVAAERHAEQYKVKKAKVCTISERLARLTLVGSVKYKQWEKSLSLPYSASHNISEGMMVHMTERGPSEWKQWMEFNKNHLTRTFPSGKVRRNLSNYNPMIPWAMGCQLVSVNVQASSGMLLLVDGRFRENGSSGYVLKPERLKEGGARVSTFQEQIEREFPKQLQLRILGGHGLPKPEGVTKGVPAISPRVKVVLYDGVPGEGSVQYTTKTVNKNGLCPVWNEDEGAMFTVSSPSTAMVLFTVWDRDNELNKDFFIAASAIPFSCLRKGYRSVPLFDSNHTRSGAYGLAFLLVDIDIQ